MAHPAHREREALCDTFLDWGPDAPTLCQGWCSADLASHLVVRERRPDAAAGIVLPPLHAYQERVRLAVRDKLSWGDLVAKVRSGPPGPLRWGPVDDTWNSIEMFVHHEDVRRAQAGWLPRSADPALEAQIWRALHFLGKARARKLPAGLQLQADGYGTLLLSAKEPLVTMRGRPGEAALWLLGRDAVAQVELEGDAAAVDRLQASTRRF
jgi:uncharacterized protein (TIGR03085 family)